MKNTKTIHRKDDYMQTINTINEVGLQETKRLPSMTPRLGNTTYDVFIHFSETSKETLTDKVMRLIRNDINAIDIL